MREQLVAKLRPDRFTAMSGKMAAIVGYILVERFSEPAISELVVTSDGFVLAQTEGEVGANEMLGTEVDLNRNLRGARHVRSADPELRSARLGRARRRGSGRRALQPPALGADHGRLRGQVRTPRGQGGSPPLGFRRSAQPPHTLDIDPATIRMGVALFERYALGNVSIGQLAAETGFAAQRIQKVLRNPLYNGWIRRHRGPDELRLPAAWRLSPPVPDELWARVEDVRRSKTRGGGPRNRGRADLLGGLLECVCGRRVRSDGTFADSRHRKLHPGPCAAWGPRARLADATWEAPILAQVSAIQLDTATIAGVVAALGSTQRPVAIDRARLERQMRELALDHVAGGMATPPTLPAWRSSATSSPRSTTDPTSVCRPSVPSPGFGRSAKPGTALTSHRRRLTCSTRSTSGSLSPARRLCRPVSPRLHTPTDWR